MKIIESSVEVYWTMPGAEMLKVIEVAGRTAYKSEDKMTDDSAEKFVAMVMKHGHLSVIEHISVSARVICDRGVTHEIVRHRLASYTQESTRYCNYSKGKHGSELTFVRPSFVSMTKSTSKDWEWYFAVGQSEMSYMKMIKEGATPQDARSVLPNSLKTEIVMTMNLREWRHFFSLRAVPTAHPDMQVIAKMLLKEFQAHIPVVFEDFENE